MGCLVFCLVYCIILDDLGSIDVSLSRRCPDLVAVRDDRPYTDHVEKEFDGKLEFAVFC